MVEHSNGPILMLGIGAPLYRSSCTRTRALSRKSNGGKPFTTGYRLI